MAWDYTSFDDFNRRASSDEKRDYGNQFGRPDPFSHSDPNEQFRSNWSQYAAQKGKKNNLQGRINDFSNFNSPYYKMQAEAIGRATPFTNSFDLMKQDRAQGMDYNVSSALANERTKQANAARQNTISNSLVGAYLEGQGMANNLMGMDLQNDQFYANLANQRYMQQKELDNQPSFGEELFGNILGIGGGILGSYLGGPSSMLGWLNGGNRGSRANGTNGGGSGNATAYGGSRMWKQGNDNKWNSINNNPDYVIG